MGPKTIEIEIMMPVRVRLRTSLSAEDEIGPMTHVEIIGRSIDEDELVSHMRDEAWDQIHQALED
jgi:hypothetical protein